MDNPSHHEQVEQIAPKTYALVSHESAVEAIWSLAARRWQGLLDDEGVWLVPAPENCVKTQGDLKRLAREVDLASLGIRHEPLDLLVPNKSCYSRGKAARFHVWADFFLPHSFVRVHDRLLVSTPYFAVVQLAMARRADRLSRAEAEASAAEDRRIRDELGIQGPSSTASDLVRWGNIARFVRATQVLCDFMGTYRYVMEGDRIGSEPEDILYQTKPLVKPETFEAYLDEMRGAKGIMRARQVAAAAFVGAASPMETVLALMLTLPVSMGGFGLPRPKLNWEIAVEPRLRCVASQDVLFADLCWPEYLLAAEYYGWDDHFGAGQRKVAEDAARANSLSSLGWTVLHVTYEQVKTIEGVTLLARQIAHVLGYEMSEPTELELVWRSRLLALLLPKVAEAS